jgi:hypothetical protein
MEEKTFNVLVTIMILIMSCALIGAGTNWMLGTGLFLYTFGFSRILGMLWRNLQ